MIKKFAAALIAVALSGFAAQALDAASVPSRFPIPWGNSAGPSYIRDIPVDSQIPVQNGAASLTDGFPPLTFIPVGAGGTPPWGQDFNGILNQLSAWSRWQAAGGPVKYDSSFSTSIGGYPAGAVISKATPVGAFWISTVDNNTSNPDSGGANWTGFNPVSISPANYSTAAIGFAPVNLRINATASAGAFTIAIKGIDGISPSATNPVLIPFRNVSLAEGSPTVLSLQTDLMFTIASGNTMGCVSAQTCRLWVIAVNNGGTIALCAFNARSGTTIAPINEAGLQSSASGASGGNSAQTYYCSTSSVASKAIRIIGYVDVVQTVAGTWTNGPTVTQIFGPGIKKPGEVVQTAYASTAGSGSFVAISPTSAANFVKYSGTTGITISNATGTVTFLRGGVTLTGQSVGISTNAASIQASASAVVLDFPNSTSSTTYSMSISAGSIGNSTSLVEEIMG